MPTNLLTIRTKVKQLAKLSITDGQMDDLVVTCINIAYRESVKANKPREVLFSHLNVNLTSAFNGQPISLGVPDFLTEDRVTFESGLRSWKLVDIHGRVPPAPIYGKPRAYEFVAKTGGPMAIRLEPYLAINPTTDKLYFSYYQNPGLLNGDGSELITDTILEDVVRRAVSLVDIYQGKLPQAQAMLGSALPPQTDNQP